MRCDEGYDCDVCGRPVEAIVESELYLRYVLGEIPLEMLHRHPERHLRCNPAYAQYIVHSEFEPMIVDGKIGRLRAEMAHYAFPTIESFVERHNVYSNWEAHVTLSEERRPPARDFGWRQRLKRWSRHLPCRPLLRFLFVYVWQRGFLDGRAGYYFARLHAVYEFLSVAKTYELRLKQNENSRLGH